MGARKRAFVVAATVEAIVIGGMALLVATRAIPEEAPTSAATTMPPPVVYLHGFADLEKLRAANPNHHARAERIIAAADELCKPGPDQVYFASFEARNISCQGAFLRTSNPPRREIGFTLDAVRYVALITVKDSPPQFRHVPGEPVQPVDPKK